MNTSKLIALTALLGLTCSVAIAGTHPVSIDKQPIVAPLCDTGYFFGYAGMTLGQTFYNQGHFAPGYGDPTLDYDAQNDWIYGGGVGMYSDLFGGSRFEIEGFRSINGVDGVVFGGVPLASAGSIRTSAIMFNYLKEIRMGAVTGYFGGGIGGASVRYGVDIYGTVFSDSDRAFAYQFIAGVDLPVTECVSVFTQYKFLAVPGLDHRDELGGLTQESDLYSHSVMAGLRFSF